MQTSYFVPVLKCLLSLFGRFPPLYQTYKCVYIFKKQKQKNCLDNWTLRVCRPADFRTKQFKVRGNSWKEKRRKYGSWKDNKQAWCLDREYGKLPWKESGGPWRISNASESLKQTKIKLNCLLFRIVVIVLASNLSGNLKHFPWQRSCGPKWTFLRPFRHFPSTSCL